MTDVKVEPGHRYRDAMWETIARTIGYPEVIVELGTRMGDWSAAAMKKFNPRKLFTVDIWPVHSNKFNACWQRTVSVLKPWLFNQAIPLRGPAHIWGRHFPLMIDLLFHDASHKYELILKDLEVWWPKVREGGFCMVHDGNEPDVRKAVEEFFRGETVHEEFWGPKRIITFWVEKGA